MRPNHYARRVIGRIRRFPYTSAALVLALMVLVAAVCWHIDVFELPGINVIGVEQSEIGEVAIAFLMVVPAFFVDRVVTRQRMHERDIEAERLRVLRMTMRTVQDIVCNGLMSLYLFRSEAEPNVSAESLELFDRIVTDTAAKLKAIADLEEVAETRMVIGMGIDYQNPPLAVTTVR
jgi:fumarate reductase subunit D